MSDNVKCTLCIEIKTMQMYNKCIAEHTSLNNSQLCAVPRYRGQGQPLLEKNLRCVKSGYT